MVWDGASGALSEVRCIPVDQDTLQGRFTSVLIPSVVALYGNRTWIGEGAKRLRPRVGIDLRENASFFAETKNDMGIARTYYKAPAGLGSARAIASQVLRFLAEAASNESDLSVASTVVTVPASFQVAQRQDTIDAAQRANLDLGPGGLLDEPVAAFLDYIFHSPSKSVMGLAAGESRRLLVFDFGGGTCDVAIFEFSKSEHAGFSVVPLSVSRYHRLGGGDIDRGIVEDVLLKQLVAENRLDELAYEERRNILQPALLPLAESLKEKMSIEIARLKRLGRFDAVQSELLQSLPGTYYVQLHDRRLSVTSPRLSAEQFEAALQPFLELDLLQPREDEYRMSCSIFAPISDALERADLSPEDLDYCLLAGGSSLIPQVQEAVARFFKNAELLTYPTAEDAQTAIAKGAALHAMATALFGQGIVHPICHDDISFQTQSGPITLVPRGERLPFPPCGFARNERFTAPETCLDGNLPVRISLVAGRECRPLFSGTWSIPAPIREGARLWLAYRFDANQCLELRMGRKGEETPYFITQVENPLTHVVNPNKVRAEIEGMEEQLRRGEIDNEDISEHVERIGDIYRGLGQRDKAMSYLRWALRTRVGPQVYVLNKMADLACEQGNRKSAEKLYAEAARVSNWAGTYFNWALAKKNWNDLGPALELVRRAFELEQDPPYLVLQARIEKMLGNAAECDRLLTEALSRFGRPCDLGDWSLGWLASAATLAANAELAHDVERVRRERRLQRVAAPDIGVTLGYDEGCKRDAAPGSR